MISYIHTYVVYNLCVWTTVLVEAYPGQLTGVETATLFLFSSSNVLCSLQLISLHLPTSHLHTHTTQKQQKQQQTHHQQNKNHLKKNLSHDRSPNSTQVSSDLQQSHTANPNISSPMKKSCSGGTHTHDHCSRGRCSTH